MKRIGLLLVMLINALSFQVSAQNGSYPFRVKKSGNGLQSIIFIPGFASSDEVWDETKTAFEKNYTCYSLTMAGFAGVAPQPGSGFAGWAKAIAAYIKEQKIEKPVLVGHSMGGGLAMAVAADYPDLVSKIVVVDALPCLAAMTNPAFKSKEQNDCSMIVNQMKALPDDRFEEMQRMSMPRMMENKQMVDTVVGWSVKSDRGTFAEMYCDFSNTDLREKVSLIKCPVLVLLESYFAGIKPVIEDQYKNLKQADLRYAEKGLHFIMYDDKDWYLAQLNEFIPGQL